MARRQRQTPIFETERLLLRPHRAEDLDACADLWSRPEVFRFIGGRPLGREEAWARLLRYRGLWGLVGFGYWAVEDRSDASYLGDVGLARFERDIEPPLDAPEAGWALHPRCHGRGIGAEALAAVLAWADERHPRTVCMIDAQNAASMRLATRFGYLASHRARYKDGWVEVFARDAAAAGRPGPPPGLPPALA